MVSHFYVASLPAVLLAVIVGRRINTRLRPNRFNSYVYWGLAVIGGVLLLQAVAL
jgi:hypothetical protein